MFMKTNVEKMSLCGLATMFMKTKDMPAHCHDIDENERVSFGEAQESRGV
jgi:hypothetical protein